MFLNDFFTIRELTCEQNVILAEIDINAGHQIFDGHFPDSPVTPGVVQLQIVKEILENHLGRKLRMKAMRACKFLQVINPLETPTLSVSIKFTETEYVEVNASGSYGDVTFFKAQASYI